MDLVVPSNIPWEELKGANLEEFMFWLLDDLGAKDIEWRKGGQDVTSSDGGRDIEAAFHIETPDGEMEKQVWWLEIKGRSKTVEPSVVHEALNNIVVNSNVDRFVIVTNTQFSNPTREWVKEWQKLHPRPKVGLWDKHSLERMITKHPNVIARLWSEALSEQGKLESFTSRFWNQLYFPGISDLQFFWDNREKLNWTSKSLIMVVAGELTNGDISKRSWLMSSERELLAEVIFYMYINTPPLLLRAHKYGVNLDIITRIVAFIIQSSLLYLPFETVSKLIFEPEKFLIKDDTFNDELKQFILGPVLWRICTELEDVCLDDCQRISSEPILLSKKEIDNYWYRLVVFTSEKEETKKPEDDRRLIIESKKHPCTLKLTNDLQESCPLFFGLEDLSLKEKLRLLKEIMIKRLEKEAKKREKVKLPSLAD
jgi:hypothetical protein